MFRVSFPSRGGIRTTFRCIKRRTFRCIRRRTIPVEGFVYFHNSTTSSLAEAKALVEEKEDSKTHEALDMGDECGRERGKQMRPIRPSITPNRMKHEELGEFIRGFPVDIEPAQLMDAFAKKTKRNLPNVSCHNHLIHIFALSGESTRAQGIFDLMLAKGVTPDEITYHSLMNAYSNGGELKKNFEIFQHLHRNPKFLSPRPYSILIKAYAKTNQVDEAFDVIKLMKEKMRPSVEAYTGLIQACTKAQDYNRAWRAYEMMRRDGCLPDVMTYTVLMSISRFEEVKRALELFEEILERGLSPSNQCINSLLFALCSRPSYYPKAIEIFTSSVSLGFQPTSSTFKALIKGAALAGNLKDARQFFLQAMGSELTLSDTMFVYSAMFEAYSLAFPAGEGERTLTLVLPKHSSKLLQSPPPTCIEDCVNEALLLLPLLKNFPPSKDLQKPWVSFLSILAGYNYRCDARRWFRIIPKKINLKLSPPFYILMLEMYTRLYLEEEFLDFVKETDSLLSPIAPNSGLSEQEKREYKLVNMLGPEPLESLYRTILLGLAKFYRLEEALALFETMVQDKEINWKANKVHYQPLFDAFRNSSDGYLKLRLNHFT